MEANLKDEYVGYNILGPMLKIMSFFLSILNI